MKKTLAALLAASMCLSLAVPSFAATKTIDGDGDVKNPIYKYQVPINLNFAVDAFSKAEAGVKSQIYSPTFPIINKSDVILRASVSTKMVGADIVVKDKASDVTQDKVSNTDKEIYMEMVPAKTVATAAGPGSTIYTGKDTPIVTKGEPTDPDVTFTDGTGAVAATFVFDITGTTFAADPSGTGTGSPYSITIKTATEELASVDSGDVTIAAADFIPTPIEVGKAFNGKKFTIMGKDGPAVFTAAATTAAVTFTADIKTALYGTTKPTATVEVAPAKGIDATVSLDTVTTPAAYSTYDAATGAGTKGKVVLKTADPTDKDKVMFALGAATYVKPFDDSKEAVTFKEMAATNAGIGAFRFMGTVNPNATWEKSDVKVQAIFDINGMTPTTFDTLGTAITDAQNVYPAVPTLPGPSVNGKSADSSATVASVTSNGKIVVPFGLGVDATAATTVTVRYAGDGITFKNGVLGTQYTIVDSAIVFDAAFTTTFKAGSKIECKFDNSPNPSTFTLTLTA